MVAHDPLNWIRKQTCMTETITATTDNAEQIAYWNSAVADRWAKRQADIDAMMAPFTQALLGAANLSPNETLRILDVGCGSGETTLMAAGLGHDLTGVDVSTSLLNLAKARATTAGLPSIEFLLGDASNMAVDPKVDLIISRFGVMFFDDPEQAFRNLAEITKPAGRIVFVCWRSPQQNQWVTVPMSALDGLVVSGSAPQDNAPGPFAFADPAKISRVLSGAGYGDIKITPFDGDMVMGGSRGLQDAARYLTEIGPAARAIAELPQDLRPVVFARLETISIPYMRDTSLVLQGSVWVVEAVRI